MLYLRRLYLADYGQRRHLERRKYTTHRNAAAAEETGHNHGQHAQKN